MDPVAAATELLNQHLHALPDPDYGFLNMLPFTHDSDETKALKHRVAQAIIALLNGNGFIRTQTPQPSAPSQTVAVKCASCAGSLVTVRTDTAGVSMVHAHGFIGGISALNPACPHNQISLDDMRTRIEQLASADE